MSRGMETLSIIIPDVSAHVFWIIRCLLWFHKLYSLYSYCLKYRFGREIKWVILYYICWHFYQYEDLFCFVICGNPCYFQLFVSKCLYKLYTFFKPFYNALSVSQFIVESIRDKSHLSMTVVFSAILLSMPLTAKAIRK